MRKLLLIAGLLLPVAAFAQQPAAVAPLSLSPLNCDALNKTTLICVRNTTHNSIVKISCSGFWGETAMSIPTGLIRSGETTIVDFQAGKCTKQITIYTREGKQYPVFGFDTTSNTTLLVTDE